MTASFLDSRVGVGINTAGHARGPQCRYWEVEGHLHDWNQIGEYPAALNSAGGRQE
jgi:hypothetical protein